MQVIKITSQAEWDALQDQFEEGTELHIESAERITINRTPQKSSVVVKGSSSVVAWGNSSVVAWGNSSVVAWGQVATHYFSEDARLIAHDQAVIFQYINPARKANLKGDHVVKAKTPSTNEAWLSAHGVSVDTDGNVILFKRVSSEFKTQEDTCNETLWAVGSTLTHPKWNPAKNECGEGKYHACAKPYFCDEFRTQKNDQYIAIQIAVSDLYVWPKNPRYLHKIAFRKGTVLYEVDRFGNQLKEVFTND